jgi:predicted DNA-binding antitoxin AbrB/MazE fold protein
MAKSIKALFENGVFKPLAKVRLRNKQKVKLTVIATEKSTKKAARVKARRSPIADGKGITSHPAYRIVGLFKSGTHDLSANHDVYLYR